MRANDIATSICNELLYCLLYRAVATMIRDLSIQLTKIKTKNKPKKKFHAFPAVVVIIAPLRLVEQFKQDVIKSITLPLNPPQYSISFRLILTYTNRDESDPRNPINLMNNDLLRIIIIIIIVLFDICVYREIDFSSSR